MVHRMVDGGDVILAAHRVRKAKKTSKKKRTEQQKKLEEGSKWKVGSGKNERLAEAQRRGH